MLWYNRKLYTNGLFVSHYHRPIASQHVGVSSTTSTSILPGNQLLTGPSSVLPKEGHSTYFCVLASGHRLIVELNLSAIKRNLKSEEHRIQLSHVP